jgi:hypothetical protein
MESWMSSGDWEQFPFLRDISYDEDVTHINFRGLGKVTFIVHL